MQGTYPESDSDDRDIRGVILIECDRECDASICRNENTACCEHKTGRRRIALLALTAVCVFYVRFDEG